MDDADILISRSDAIATITLNRPDKINSFNRAMHRQLAAALNSAGLDDTVRAIIIKGSGRGFCAGQDLADLSMDPNAPTDLGDLVGDFFNPLVLQIQALPKPVIAQVHGIAAGAGANLALSCDLVIAADTAQFLQAFVNIGLMPDSGGTWFLPNLLGKQRAMGLALLGEKLNGADAATWGLIWQSVPADQLETATLRCASRLAKLPPRALTQIKQAILAAPNATLPAQLLREQREQSQLGKSADYFEGVNAFLEKRPALFTGA